MSEMFLLGTLWKKFKMEDIFIFHKGKRLTKEDMNPGSTNFIAAIDDNNGIRQKIDLPPLHKGNCITVNYNGSIGEAFYQEQPFRASDDVNILYPKGWILNRNIGLFLSTIIRHNKYRFGYGRKWNLDKMKGTNIALPVDNRGNPDWKFMENYIDKFMDLAKIDTKVKHTELPFDTTKWKKFIIGDLFNLDIAKSVDFGGQEKGDVKFIGRTANNNGLQGFVNVDANKITRGGCITISMVGTFCALWQDVDFVASQNILVLRNENLNKYNGLFIASTIGKMLEIKYSYNRPIQKRKFELEKIKLPVDRNSNLDWDYMEKYIKSLPYTDLI